MRRVIKPFAVEVRSSGRKTRVGEPKATLWPELADQPVVEWPSSLSPFRSNPQLAQPADQLLVAQDTEPYRDPRKLPPARAVMHDVTVFDVPPAKPRGRVLPVIEDPKPLKIEAAEQVITARLIVRAKKEKASRVAEPIAALAGAVQEAAVGLTVALEVPARRRGADRPARADFKRGERWKARLPAAVHRDPKR